MAVGAPGKFLDTSVATLRGEDATIAELRKTYPAELLDLKNLFTEWSDADLLFALDEAGGAVDLAFYRISDGHAERWEEVVKKDKKDRKKVKPDPQNLPTVGTKPAKKSVKSTSRPVSLKKDVEPSPEQDRTSKGSLKPAAADAKTAPTQQPRLESSYRGRGRGSRRGDRAVIYRQSSETAHGERSRSNSVDISTAKPRDDTPKRQKKPAVAKQGVSRIPSARVGVSLQPEPESHRKVTFKIPAPAAVPPEKDKPLSQPASSQALKPSPDARVRSPASWAQMVKSAIKIGDTEDAPQKDDPPQHKSNYPAKETPVYSARTTTPSTNDAKSERESFGRSAGDYVEEKETSVLLKDSFKFAPSTLRKPEVDLLDGATLVECEYSKYTVKKSPTQRERMMPLKQRPVDPQRATSTAGSATHHQKLTVKKQSKYAGIIQPQSRDDQTFISSQSSGTKESGAAQNEVGTDAEPQLSIPTPVNKVHEYSSVETIQRKLSSTFEPPIFQSSDAQAAAPDMALSQKKVTKKPPAVTRGNPPTPSDSLASKISSLSVRFGSVHLDPESRGIERDHIVFPTLSKSGPPVYAQPVNEDDSGSDNNNAGQDGYSYPHMEQKAQNLSTLGGAIRPFQEAKSLFNILQNGNCADLSGYSEKNAVPYQSRVQSSQKTAMAAEGSSSFDPPAQSSFILPQSQTSRAGTRTSMPVKCPVEQKGRSRVFNRYTVEKTDVSPLSQPSSRIPPLSTSPSQQTQASMSTPAAPQTEVPTQAFSHANATTQGAQVSSALDSDFQNRGPIAGTGVTLPLPLQQFANSTHQTPYHIPIQQSHSQQSFMHQQLPHAPCPAPYHYMPFYVPDINTPYYGFSVGNAMRYHQMYHSQSQRNHSYPVPESIHKNISQNTGEQRDSLEQQVPSSEGLFQLQVPHLYPVQNHMCGIVHQQYSRERQLSPYSDITNSPTDLPPIRGPPVSDFRGPRNELAQQQDLHMLGLHYGGITPDGNHQSVAKAATSIPNNAQQPGAVHGDYLTPGVPRRHQLYEQHTTQTATSASPIQNPNPMSGVLMNQSQSLSTAGSAVPPIGAAGGTKGPIPGQKVPPYHNQPYNISNFNDPPQQEGLPFNETSQQGLHQNSFYAQNRQQPHFWLNSE